MHALSVPGLFQHRKMSFQKHPGQPMLFPDDTLPGPGDVLDRTGHMPRDTAKKAFSDLTAAREERSV